MNKLIRDTADAIQDTITRYKSDRILDEQAALEIAQTIVGVHKTLAAAALADPDVDKAAKSYAGYVLSYLEEPS